MKHATLSAIALVLAMAPVACAQGASAFTPQAAPVAGHPNSIQPETTIQLSAESRVNRAPDIAFITAGVTQERATAGEAMAAQSAAMNGVFEALRASGVADRDMQTSGLSLSPRYDYIETPGRDGRIRGEQRLAGYVASNQVTVRVRDLANLGETLDRMVASGGNTISGISFAIDDDKPLRNEARANAMKEAIAKAELYASAAGLRVGRIVTIREGYEASPQPMPMARMAMAEAMDMSTPVAGGEVGITANVSVLFELVR
ncbi:SIMPL domain-containing protein [Hyphomonas sp.]|uniref:SIMPL domain-containing protein n=1 Tax=Hyphomonas sp. TaxID=87 RepID=UPI00391B5F06